MSDTQHSLGKLIQGDPERDAVHIAVVAVEADTVLSPGMRVGFTAERKAARVVPEIIGIVDPFLTETVYPGDKFFMFLLPNTITSLKHNWTHPAFENVAPAVGDPKAVSEAWLRDFCAKADCPGYDKVMAAIMGSDPEQDDDRDWYSSRIDGDYLHFSGRDAHGEIPAEFWLHVEVVLGRQQEQRPAYFSCSC